MTVIAAVIIVKIDGKSKMRHSDDEEVKILNVTKPRTEKGMTPKANIINR